MGNIAFSNPLLMMGTLGETTRDGRYAFALTLA
jgi:hypothetical protein